jgi:hypothetical protein
MENKTVIVIGVGRGGTSLTAGILNGLGVQMGENQKPGDGANEHGYFENKVIEDFNIRECLEPNGFFTNYRGGYVNPLPLPKLEEVYELYPKLKDRVIEIVKQEAHYPIWGWKDERNLWTSQLFLNHIENPHFIVNYREPTSTANSLRFRDGKPTDMGLEIVKQYNELIEEFFKKWHYPRLNIHYERYFEEGEKQVKEICEFLELPFNKEVLELIDPKIKHF